MKYPSSWTLVDNEKIASASAEASADTKSLDEPAPAAAVKGLEGLAKMNGFTISKYPVDHVGPNPSMLAAFLPLPPEAARLPREKILEVMRLGMAASFLKGAKNSASDVEVLEPPSDLAGSRGVWFTIKGKPSAEPGSAEAVARVYMFLAKNKIILVSMSYPPSGAESESSSVLSAMIESMKY